MITKTTMTHTYEQDGSYNVALTVTKDEAIGGTIVKSVSKSKLVTYILLIRFIEKFSLLDRLLNPL